MKHLSITLVAVGVALAAGMFTPSCKDTVLGPNEIGGETNLPLTQVGNDFGLYVTIDGTSLPLKDTLYITKSENGIVTFKVKAEIAGNPLAVLVPADLKDSTGNINAEIKLKITSEGIQEFYTSHNNMGQPFTIAKHDAKVGDKYEFTNDSGVHIVRTITEKTGVDEWPLGFYLIKTAATEESPTPHEGVSKIVFRTNHKFGLVYIEYTTTTGNVIKVNLMPWAVM